MKPYINQKNVTDKWVILPMVRDFLTTNGKDILDITFLNDEVWFHSSMYINSQNSCVWSAFKPYEIMDTPLHD